MKIDNANLSADFTENEARPLIPSKMGCASICQANPTVCNAFVFNETNQCTLYKRESNTSLGNDVVYEMEVNGQESGFGGGALAPSVGSSLVPTGVSSPPGIKIKIQF